MCLSSTSAMPRSALFTKVSHHILEHIQASKYFFSCIQYFAYQYSIFFYAAFKDDLGTDSWNRHTHKEYHNLSGTP